MLLYDYSHTTSLDSTKPHGAWLIIIPHNQPYQRGSGYYKALQTFPCAALWGTLHVALEWQSRKVATKGFSTCCLHTITCVDFLTWDGPKDVLPTNTNNQ